MALARRVHERKLGSAARRHGRRAVLSLMNSRNRPWERSRTRTVAHFLDYQVERAALWASTDLSSYHLGSSSGSAQCQYYHTLKRGFEHNWLSFSLC